MNPSILALISLILGFLICSFIPENRHIRDIFITEPPGSDDNTRSVIFQRVLVVFFFGFMPIFIITITGHKPADSGLGSSNMGFSLISGFTIGFILILLNFLNRRNPGNLSMYPVIRKKEWTSSLLLLSALSWVVYLFSYEFLFRGYLLFSMKTEFGMWNAVVVNVVLYSLVHVPKGWKEAVGSLPLGFVLCVVCLRAGNIWPAFIAHSCLALSNEWFALAIHPTISIHKKRRAVL
jgi:membrane protease YdiL (CAAX protease family)